MTTLRVSRESKVIKHLLLHQRVQEWGVRLLTEVLDLSSSNDWENIWSLVHNIRKCDARDLGILLVCDVF